MINIIVVIFAALSLSFQGNDAFIRSRFGGSPRLTGRGRGMRAHTRWAAYHSVYRPKYLVSRVMSGIELYWSSNIDNDDSNKMGTASDISGSALSEATAFLKQAGTDMRSLEASPRGAELVRQLTDAMIALQSRGLGTALVPLLNDSSVMFEVSSHSDTWGANEAGTFDAGTVDVDSSPGAVHNITADELFSMGANHSLSWREMLERRWSSYEGEALRPAAQFPVAMESFGMRGQRFDLFADPSTYTGGLGAGAVGASDTVSSSANGTEQMHAALGVGMKQFPVKPERLESDRASVLHAMQELMACNDDMMRSQILRANRDVMLSDNFIYIMHQLNATNRVPDQRRALAQLVNASVEVVTELAYAVEMQSARHLRTIHDVCEVASKHRFEPIVFMERMNEIKPRFDTELYGFLQYAIREEEVRLQRLGITAPSAWLQVLKIVETGVYEEFAARYDRVLEPIILSLRFDPQEFRSELFGRFVNITAPMDLRFMRELAVNMVEGTLNVPAQKDFISRSSIEGFAGDDSMETRLRGLRNAVDVYLSTDYIDAKEKEFKLMAAAQNTDVIIQPRNPSVIPDNFLLDDAISLLNDDEINRGSSAPMSGANDQDLAALGGEDDGDNDEDYGGDGSQEEGEVSEQEFGSAMP
jgi:hypothetical protein